MPDLSPEENELLLHDICLIIRALELYVLNYTDVYPDTDRAIYIRCKLQDRLEEVCNG